MTGFRPPTWVDSMLYRTGSGNDAILDQRSYVNERMKSN